jgi:toxin ParE1/3/4
MSPRAAQVFWTPQAIADLEAIRDFIARDSARHGALVTASIRRAVSRLRTFPRSGRVVAELGDPDIREVIVGTYRVVYLLRRTRVEVLTVFHGAQDIGAAAPN